MHGKPQGVKEECLLTGEGIPLSLFVWSADPDFLAIPPKTIRFRPSASTDLGDQENLALGRQLQPIGVLMNFAVDRHRHRLLDMLPKARKPGIEFADQATETGGLHLELGLLANQMAAARARDGNLRHQPLPESMAATIFGGDIGRLRYNKFLRAGRAAWLACFPTQDRLFDFLQFL